MRKGARGLTPCQAQRGCGIIYIDDCRKENDASNEAVVKQRLRAVTATFKQVNEEAIKQVDSLRARSQESQEPQSALRGASERSPQRQRRPRLSYSRHCLAGHRQTLAHAITLLYSSCIKQCRCSKDVLCSWQLRLSGHVSLRT